MLDYQGFALQRHSAQAILIRENPYYVDGHVTTSYSGQGNYPTPHQIANAMNRDAKWMGSIIVGFYNPDQDPYEGVIEGYKQVRDKVRDDKVVVPAQVVQCGDVRNYYLVGIIYRRPIEKREDIYVGRSLAEIQDFARNNHVVFYPHPFAPSVTSIMWHIYGLDSWKSAGLQKFGLDRFIRTTDFRSAEIDGAPLFPDDLKYKAIDVANGQTRGFNWPSKILADRLNLPFIAGSNAREIQYVGKPALTLERKVETPQEVINLILEREFEIDESWDWHTPKVIWEAYKEKLRFGRR